MEATDKAPRSPLRERAMQRLKLLQLEHSSSEEEKLPSIPFELDKDLTISNDISSISESKQLVNSKSLQVAKDPPPAVLKQRHSLDAQELEAGGEIVSSIDSSLLQVSPRGPDEPLDPLETSEDSCVEGVERVQVEAVEGVQGGVQVEAVEGVQGGVQVVRVQGVQMEAVERVETGTPEGTNSEPVTVVSLRKAGEVEPTDVQPTADLFIYEEPWSQDAEAGVQTDTGPCPLHTLEHWLWKSHSGKEAKGLRLIGAFAKYIHSLK